MNFKEKLLKSPASEISGQMKRVRVWSAKLGVAERSEDGATVSRSQIENNKPLNELYMKASI